MSAWKARRDYLCKLIKNVSDRFGGDDVVWLREYAKEVVKIYASDLEVAITCFADMEVKECNKKKWTSVGLRRGFR
jgi:hypothetical protein